MTIVINNAVTGAPEKIFGPAGMKFVDQAGKTIPNQHPDDRRVLCTPDPTVPPPQSPHAFGLQPSRPKLPFDRE
jgi:hypothetical protein